MPRFVIVARRRGEGFAPYCHYISKSGCLTTSSERAFPIVGKSEAKLELDYWRRNLPNYSVSAEQLPPRSPVATGILRAVPVEL